MSHRKRFGTPAQKRRCVEILADMQQRPHPPTMEEWRAIVMALGDDPDEVLAHLRYEAWLYELRTGQRVEIDF